MSSEPGASPVTRTDLPIAEDGGIHPGLAMTAMDRAKTDVADSSDGFVAAPNKPSHVETDVWIGRVLANVYKVEAKIGEGGMGAVYRATHVHIGKQVAVKVLTDLIAKKGDAVERLKQEAIAASSIDHDNIVDVISFDRFEDGSVFIVMEFLRGESLAERLDRLREANQRMPLAEVITIALQVCDALGAAHERNIVHRDLKPENIFLQKKGEKERVKVLDFGISKIKTAEAEQVRMTRTGQLVGTPLYMSPEQARGETDIDRRVDLYALGVMLFEMLTGAPPFDGRNYFELLWKHGNEPAPSLQSRCPDAGYSTALDAALQRVLAKDKNVRFGTMREFADALSGVAPEASLSGITIPPEARLSAPSNPGASARASFGHGATIQVPTPAPGTLSAIPAPPAKSMWPMALGALALVLLGGGAYFATQAPDPVTPAVTPEATPEATPVATPTPVPSQVDPIPEAVQTPTPVPPSAPSQVTLSIGSTPTGAQVFQGDTPVCSTPCLEDFEDGAELVLTFRHAGYQDAVEHVHVSEGAAVSPRLRARRQVPESEQGSAVGIKTTL